METTLRAIGISRGVGEKGCVYPRKRLPGTYLL